MKNRLLPVAVGCILLVTAGSMARAQSANPGIQPEAVQLPEWLHQGKFRFARFDGGPIEIQKTIRSAWGMRFTPEEQKVLANVYGKHEYGPRMADLLAKAHVNFVWVTYSVGFSWEDESPQRALVREMTGMLHARGIKVAAYMDAHSMFWQSMFRDVPQSVRWIIFDPDGLPYRYSGGRDALRFIANLNDPAWVKYEEKRISAIIDDGLDAIFFDNTASSDWSSNENVAAFFTKIRDFIHNDKHSDIPIFSNFGLVPSRAALNRYMDFTFDEYWVEPGVWGKDWEVSNIRRTRYIRGMLPPQKPLITEYSRFHEGNRSTGFLKAGSVELSIAEAAAFGAAYTWDMEGPFDERLIKNDPEAHRSWEAISHYNGFLADHESLYTGAEYVTPLAVLLPDDFQPGFSWDDPAPLLDCLSRSSVLYAIKLARSETEADLKTYAGVILPWYDGMSPREQSLVHEYVAGGGKIYAFGAESGPNSGFTEFSDAEILQRLESDKMAQEEVITKVKTLAKDTTQVELVTGDHVLANVTVLNKQRETILHLLNYNAKPAENLEITLSLTQPYQDLVGKSPAVMSPDAESVNLKNVRWDGNTLRATLSSLKRYSIIVLK
ncbi:MAG TPA: hypothetical protein VNM47_13020 [Terriglobia bacterium]|nr:hypothetical protein [Terriglobia bacterium]